MRRVLSNCVATHQEMADRSRQVKHPSHPIGPTRLPANGCDRAEPTSRRRAPQPREPACQRPDPRKIDDDLCRAPLRYAAPDQLRERSSRFPPHLQPRETRLRVRRIRSVPDLGKAGLTHLPQEIHGQRLPPERLAVMANLPVTSHPHERVSMAVAFDVTNHEETAGAQHTERFTNGGASNVTRNLME